MCLPLFCVADNNYCILANSTSLSGPSRGGGTTEQLFGDSEILYKNPLVRYDIYQRCFKGTRFLPPIFCFKMFQKTGLSDKQVNIFLVYMVSTLSYVL